MLTNDGESLPSEISLAQALASLRDQLDAAVADARCHRIRFGLRSVEIELTVGLSTRSGWQVLPIDGNAVAEPQRLQKLRLVLDPRKLGLDGSTEIELGGDDPGGGL